MNILRKHYSGSYSGRAVDLIQEINEGLKKVNKFGTEALAPVDEFHIGGRKATVHFINHLNLQAGDSVLDIGCGLGGAARYVAGNYDCRVLGIDVTKEYIEVGKHFNNVLGLESLVTMKHGNVLEMEKLYESYPAHDHAMMLHVGMNIENKQLLFEQVNKQLRKGGKFGIYDVMRVGPNKNIELDLPVPWATTSETNACDSVNVYITALQKAGFKVIVNNNRRKFAIDFFDQLQQIQKKQAAENNGGPPPLGLHLIMDNFQQKMRNLILNLKEERIAPIELISEKL